MRKYSANYYELILARSRYLSIQALLRELPGNAESDTHAVGIIRLQLSLPLP